MPQQPRFQTTPLWEPRISGSANWTSGTLRAILNFAPNLLQGSEDIKDLCPSYLKLTLENRAGFLVYFISALARYESGFETTTRYHESTMGNDAVTGLPVYSEGLLQLSYQDTKWAPFCEFDWTRDRTLSPTDPRKTIFDPIKNLSCGIRILDRQVEKKGKLLIGSGAYWAVIKTDAPHNKILEIKALTRDLPVCQYGR
ncbi:MAG: hypothetical protein K2X47_13355 [Bdellovibrionales bacterium]|nr:hypothetical protein [Bdellovibrionales bacterium]